MKIKRETRIKIKIKGDNVTNLKSAIDKIISESKQIGFKNIQFSDDERDV